MTALAGLSQRAGEGWFRTDGRVPGPECQRCNPPRIPADLSLVHAGEPGEPPPTSPELSARNSPLPGPPLFSIPARLPAPTAEFVASGQSLHELWKCPGPERALAPGPIP